MNKFDSLNLKNKSWAGSIHIYVRTKVWRVWLQIVYSNKVPIEITLTVPLEIKITRHLPNRYKYIGYSGCDLLYRAERTGKPSAKSLDCVQKIAYSGELDTLNPCEPNQSINSSINQSSFRNLIYMKRLTINIHHFVIKITTIIMMIMMMIKIIKNNYNKNSNNNDNNSTSNNTNTITTNNNNRKLIAITTKTTTITTGTTITITLTITFTIKLLFTITIWITISVLIMLIVQYT